MQYFGFFFGHFVFKMESGSSGEGPPKRVCAEKVFLTMFMEMNDDDEEYGIMSESMLRFTDRSRSSESSSSESEEEKPVCVSRSKKGALPSTRSKGKKIPA